jgi:S1-C subfamily serine protease
MQQFLRLVLLLALFVPWAGAQAAPGVAESMVRISTSSQQPDYAVPWNPGSMSGGVGAGFVIAGNRIMTNAHVVSNATFITVLKEVEFVYITVFL